MKAVDKASSAGQSARLGKLRQIVEDEGIQDKVDAAKDAAEGKGSDAAE